MVIPINKIEWKEIPGGITTPRGFQAAGIKAGLKSSHKRDLALLLAPEGAICAGTFTQSCIRAACVDLCEERLIQKSGYARAVLINSGQANACTGKKGRIDCIKATEVLAKKLGLAAEEVLMCSTGVIGEPIAMKKLLFSLDKLIEDLNEYGGDNAAQGIITTDLTKKQIAFEGEVEGNKIHVGGMAKGSGMIHPNMATMLAYITCDVSLNYNDWKNLTRKIVDKSFNSITVDGDTSTNDTLLAFCAGQRLAEKHIPYLEEGVKLVGQHLAMAIARDGEGANCLIEVEVKGTKTDNDARQIARTICSSPLVKTAIHGNDPNWGRIIAAAGRSKIDIDETQVSLWIGNFQLLANGKPMTIDRIACSNYIKDRMKGNIQENDKVIIKLIVGNGPGVGNGWGCDLSNNYVSINADYTT